jgi:phage terminase small subunit
MPLSIKEQAFVRHFLAGQSGVRGNATQAYVAAGYAPKAAYSGASELLRKPRIQEAIAAYLRKADLTVGRVLEELRRVAFADMWNFGEWGPGGVVMKASAELDDDVAPAVADVIERRTTRTTTRAMRAVGKPGEPGYVPEAEVKTITEERNTRVKLHDKVQALVALSKFLGILRQDADQPAQRPLLPKGFFAAVITGDVERIKGFLPEETVLETTLPPGSLDNEPSGKPWG